MRYHERLNIVFMRDNGPRRSIRIRRSRFYLILLFFSSLPFLCILLAVQCWFLWQDNIKFRENLERFETDYQLAEARAKRLENLEEILKEEKVNGREIILGNLAVPQNPAIKSTQVSIETSPEALPEGPGHEEFPALDTGRVKVNNVQARMMRDNSIRIGVDLRNPDNEKVLSGVVNAILVTSNGEKYNLLFDPEDIGNFRINRFKRTVINANAPKGVNLVNSEIILEVKGEDGAVIYRNIFAVQR